MNKEEKIGGYLLQSFLEDSVKKYPNKIAIKHEQETITYAKLYQQALGLGHYTRKISAERGERIGILLDKSIKQIICLLGVLYADKVFVLIDIFSSKKQIEHILNDCDIKILISSRKKQVFIDGIQEKTKLKKIIYDDEIKKAVNKKIKEKYVNKNISDDISHIIYTSGSTGLPKGVVLTHRNLIDGAKSVAEYLKITKKDKILGLLPLHFDYGLNQLTTTLYKGCTLVLFQFFLPKTLFKVLMEEKITGLPALPPVWASVFNPKVSDIEKKKYKFSYLRYITNSGGKIPVPTVKKIRKFFPKTDLYLMYGLTEAFRSTYLDPKEVDRRPDSIGKAIPNVQIEVINKNGKVCKPGEEGELIHRGACIARGYWNNPEKTLERYKSNPLMPKNSQFLETVVYSGDLVKKDKEGFIYFIGRKDNMIKTSGYRVSPTEVEEMISDCKGVADMVVFGVEDEEIGQKIRAVITVTNDKITPESIIEHCKGQGPFYLVPKEVFIVKSFPKTASGKLDRPKIMRESIKEQGS